VSIPAIRRDPGRSHPDRPIAEGVQGWLFHFASQTYRLTLTLDCAASRAMKRTSSGSDLSGSTLLGVQTPYVYMAAQQVRGANQPLSPMVDRAEDDPSVFRRHCGGGTARKLHTASPMAFSFPAGFIVVVADGFLTATEGDDALFSVPLGAVLRVQLLRSSGASANLLSLLCGCCYGERQKVLALDLNAPVGWLQWAPVMGDGIVGPVRVRVKRSHTSSSAAPVCAADHRAIVSCLTQLELQVLDADEYLDAMGLSLD
jgi:hypothetical protein